MGCICGKNLVKSSIEHVAEKKNDDAEIEAVQNINQSKEPLQETSNESDRVANAKIISLEKIKEKSEKVYEFPIISIPMQDFYAFSSENPAEFESSHSNDWEQIIAAHCKSLKNTTKTFRTTNSIIKNDWDSSITIELTKEILIMPTRQWANEQIYLVNKAMKNRQGIGRNVRRKNIQLKQQFEWFIWAVANFWYLYLGGKSKKVNNEFDFLTGKKVGLPQNKEEWLSGFIYKSVKFQIFLRQSPECSRMKAEFKSIKYLFLESYPCSKSLVFPLLTQIKIGPFVLFAAPVYPNAFLTGCNDLFLDLFGEGNFCVPRSCIFQLKVEVYVHMVYNASEFVPCEGEKKYIITFNALDNKKAVFENFYDKGVPKKDILQLLNCEKYASVKIENKTIEAYGWKCVIFWDDNTEIKKQHEFNGFFGGVPGNFVGFFFEIKKRAKRNSDTDYNTGDKLFSLKNSIRDCVNTLENSDSINSQKALSELMKRKGLHSYHEWLIYSKCRSERTTYLLEASLLSQAIKAYVYNFMHSKDQTRIKNLQILLSECLLACIRPESKDNQILVSLGFVLFLKRLTCMTEAKALKTRPDQSCSRIIEPLKEKLHSCDFLGTGEMISKILSVGSKWPKQLLKAVEDHMNIAIDSKILSEAANDSFGFLQKPEILNHEDISYLRLAINSVTTLREDSYLLYLSLTDKPYYEENSMCSINESQIYFMQKENEFTNLEMILPGELYSQGNRFYKESYSIGKIELLEEWASCHEFMCKDLVTPNGQEAVLIEIYLHQCAMLLCQNKDAEGALKVLKKATGLIDFCYWIEAELVIAYYMWFGLCHENINNFVAEQSFITALILMTRAFGDPRGRNNHGVPWQMIAGFKLSKIAREEKRIFDAQLAEEHFDSVYMNSSEFKHKSQKKYNRRYAKQQASIYKSPFESSEPQWEDLLNWTWSTSVFLFSSNLLWTQSRVKEFINLTKVSQIALQIGFVVNTSGTSTPSSYKDTKRGFQQNSLSQALLSQDCALHTDSMKGVIYIWGSDTDGQLGISNEKEASPVLMFPRLLTALKDVIIKEVAAGALHCVAITIEGTCYAWGNNEGFQLGLGPDLPKQVESPVLVKTLSRIESAACGYRHSVFLNNTGQLFTTGEGGGGVLGHGNCNTIMFPSLIVNTKKIKIQQIQAGGYHNVALTDNGHVYVWGRGDGGQLGLEQEDLIKNGEDIYVDVPIKIKGILENKKIIQIACGEAHNLVLTNEGKVFAWGWGSNGQLGNGYREEDFEESGNLLSIQYTPAPILSFSFPIIQVAAGGLFSMFLASDKEVYICGANDKRQLGLEVEVRDVAIPTRIESFVENNIKNIACGESHCVAISDKLVWTWGNHLDYRLGIGEVTGFSAPRILQSLTSSEIVKVACGRIHTMIVVGKGAMQTQIVNFFDTLVKWDIEI
ncbi:hypothetical protein SteCoe_24296 [Stentor coeruleus]|uniref:RCC1-like domain-containing protein n=1 Tax=Stentor coeruleus TaxID=5963 RepID=A0A1R2BI10_9CILI|nr:hypothetical protein SteCoe_24296 [Stentor coeruleus]